tara:strand:- start:265 stop:1359 length:1095 start_codon:yes stop_codon:yes gene_type:complete
MGFTLKEICEAVGGYTEGDANITVNSVSEPGLATEMDLAFAADPKFADQIKYGDAKVAILSPGMNFKDYGLKGALVVERARYAMASLTKLVDNGQRFQKGIHSTAIVSDKSNIGENASIGAYAIISDGVDLGEGSVVGPMCYIGTDSKIGANAYLREGVKIGSDVFIGDRFIAQPGAVIGGDGFSFVTAELSDVEIARESLGKAQTSKNDNNWVRIHSLAGVVLGDDVEVGANSTIDRGTVRATRLGNNVKTDNLSQIGHNVSIGNNCLICAQVGVAGSSRIGNNVVLGGQTGISDNIIIGDNVITGGATKVLSNVPSGKIMLGYPATSMDKQIQSYKALRKLPNLIKQISDLQKAILKKNKRL